MKFIFPTFSVLLLSVLLSCKTDAPLSPVSETKFCNSGTALHDTVVLLVMGQSNAANSGQTLYFSHCDNTFNFYNGKLYPLHDPLKGANGAGGSVWSRLADKMMEQNFAHTVIVAPCAVGGTRIEQWIPGGDLNHLISETVSSLDTAGLKVSYILWHQGESNHVALSGGLSAAQNALNYTDNFHLLWQFMRGLGVSAPMYPAIATRCAGDPDYALEQAQRNLANDSLGIFNGPNTDILGNEFRYDNCHFNDTGLNLHAEMWLEAIRH